MFACLVEGCAEVFESSGKRHKHLVDSHRYPESFDFSRYYSSVKKLLEDGTTGFCRDPQHKLVCGVCVNPVYGFARACGGRAPGARNRCVVKTGRITRLPENLSLLGMAFDRGRLCCCDTAIADFEAGTFIATDPQQEAQVSTPRADHKRPNGRTLVVSLVGVQEEPCDALDRDARSMHVQCTQAPQQLL